MSAQINVLHISQTFLKVATIYFKKLQKLFKNLSIVTVNNQF
jgi:hypothetical protein